jgi:hypothetical protein
MRQARPRRARTGLGLAAAVALGLALAGVPWGTLGPHARAQGAPGKEPAQEPEDEPPPGPAQPPLPELHLPEPRPPEDPEPAPAPAPVALQPAAAVPPPAPQSTRPSRQPALELGVLASVHAQVRTYGLGGGLELGGRWQLGLAGLGVSLRLLYESYRQPEPAPSLLSITLPVTVRFGRPRSWVRPYLGLGPQLLLQKIPEALGARPSLRSEHGAAFYFLAGAQVSVRPAAPLWGGPFVEVSYRCTIYNPTGSSYPAWNTAAVLLGYRLNTP